MPSALIGQPAPQTVLAPLPGLERDGKPVPGLDPADFKGAVTVLNVWASWCVPCLDEAPLLLKLAADRRIRMVGINQKDQPDNARRFLGRHGNPFVAVGVDPNGRASIEWGVYGVPETFVIGRDGRIAYKLIGADHGAESTQPTLKPQIEKALAAPPSPERFPLACIDASLGNRMETRNEKDLPWQLPSASRIRFEADIDLSEGTGKCNCTACWKLRWWGVGIKPDAFRLTTDEESTGYGFPTDRVRHTRALLASARSCRSAGGTFRRSAAISSRSTSRASTISIRPS